MFIITPLRLHICDKLNDKYQMEHLLCAGKIYWILLHTSSYLILKKFWENHRLSMSTLWRLAERLTEMGKWLTIPNPHHHELSARCLSHTLLNILCMLLYFMFISMLGRILIFILHLRKLRYIGFKKQIYGKANNNGRVRTHTQKFLTPKLVSALFLKQCCFCKVRGHILFPPH